MISQIRDNIYLSGKSEAMSSNISKIGITTIVNVASEVKMSSSSEIEVINCGFHDSAVAAAKYSADIVSQIVSLLETNHKVLICCKQGASRSPHITALVLSVIERIDYDKAYNEIIDLHPRTMKYSIGQEICDKNIS